MDPMELTTHLGDKAIKRIGYGAMQLAGPGVFGPPKDPDEARAWTVRRGSTAPECAGAIHSDLERGFIRAETIAYDDFIEAGSAKAAREKGLFRVEGKDYIVKDGDILNIRFNV